jgi:iron complex transport system substrate-binding protein
VPLEQIVADPPDVLLSGVTRPGAPSRAESLLRHQALAHLADRMRRETFPQKLLFCGGPVLIQTAQALAQARRAALEAVA